MSDIQTGDRVRVTYEGEVTDKLGGGRFLAVDGRLHDVYRPKQIEVLTPPKPKDGDVITGRRLQQTRWKRGSIVAHDPASLGHLLSGWVLRADGRWHSLDYADRSYEFDAFTASSKYKVVHVEV